MKLTNEEILDLLLFKIVNVESDEECDVELKHLICYILEQNPNGLSEEEINNKINEMLLDYTLTSLSKKGYIDPSFDENGDIRYSLSEQGENYFKAFEDEN